MKNKFYLIPILLLGSLTGCEENNIDLKISTSCAPMYDIVYRLIGVYGAVKCVAPDDPFVTPELDEETVEYIKDSDIFFTLNSFDNWANSLDFEGEFYSPTENMNIIDDNSYIHLSFINYARMVNNVYNKLVELDYKNRKYYSNGLEIVLDVISEVKGAYDSYFQNATGDFVTDSDYFVYLADEYNMPYVNLKDQTSTQIKEYLVDNDYHYFFVEDPTNEDYIAMKEALEDEHYSLSLLKINPYLTVDIDHWGASSNYIKVMYDNLDSFKKAFGE